ncbi:uncharacterized protein LOC144179346 isoform X2 [Haemaphysalis longicornis]
MKIATVIAFLVTLTTTPPGAFCNDYLKDLFRLGKKRDLTMHLCYRNGTTFEPVGAQNVQLLWTGRDMPKNRVHVYFSFVLPGEQNRRNGTLTAIYLPGQDYAKLVADAEVGISRGGVVLKIFDIDPTCKNAEEQRERVCPDPCNWEHLY